jgi:hypothetical protein
MIIIIITTTIIIITIRLIDIFIIITIIIFIIYTIIRIIIILFVFSNMKLRYEAMISKQHSNLHGLIQSQFCQYPLYYNPEIPMKHRFAP